MNGHVVLVVIVCIGIFVIWLGAVAIVISETQRIKFQIAYHKARTASTVATKE